MLNVVVTYQNLHSKLLGSLTRLIRSTRINDQGLETVCLNSLSSMFHGHDREWG
ncbi:hypothetical protein FHT80_002151 [Rhizobium sp. BK226]|nr:hypothetical protein [Rhizobium sp. BK226]